MDYQQILVEVAAWVSGQPDAREGVVPFLEKREPVWKLQPSSDLPDAG